MELKLSANNNRRDPDAMYRNLLRTNPQFAQFVKQNAGKTPEQIAMDYGIDFSLIRNLMK